MAVDVQRLGVKARAAGIHLIFAAQRPDVNVMPMQLRDNLGQPPDPEGRQRRHLGDRAWRERRGVVVGAWPFGCSA